MQTPEHSKKAAYTAKEHNELKDTFSYDVSEGVLKREITWLKTLCHGNAVNAGWYTDLDTGEFKQLNVGERIALMHSELSEAFEAHRKNLMDDHLPHRKGIEVELADTIIRIMDFCGAEDLDIAGAILEKVSYNLRRADHSIAARKLEGGKKC